MRLSKGESGFARFAGAQGPGIVRPRAIGAERSLSIPA